MAGVVLGISPGTRIIGLAVVINGELVEWKVKSFKEKWCPEKQTGIISIVDRLIDYYGVKAISLKKIDPLKSSNQLDSLMAAIEKLGIDRNIAFNKYSLTQLAYDHQSGIRIGKAKLAETIVERHPELKKEYFKEVNSQVEYYSKMFEAVALAEHC